MEAVGLLTGGIAHDFNNLLAVVLGNLDLARKRLPDDPKLRGMIENSIKATKRGAALTQRMLAFARRQELKTESVDVPGLVREMANLLQRSIGPLIEIGTQFPLRLARVFSDPNQLELVLLNLAVNARDAMPEGGSITIAAREELVRVDDASGLTPGSYVCLSVTDTGEGMDEATLARAAEPFFTTKGVGKGTGLGLSMIHGFAEQSGGRLVLKSRSGQGTTAEIWLPVADAKAEAPTAEGADPGSFLSSEILAILVVDDDNLVLMNTVAMLEDLGHSVVEATSGEQALRLLRRGASIDLVITDQLMPGMTGTELVDAIRSERPDVPAILATGYSELAAGAAPKLERLSKPFTQDDLARAIATTVTHPVEPGRVVPFRRG
jgi:CheY-like chemotaxis protein/two-component sensor histidine kinase